MKKLLTIFVLICSFRSSGQILLKNLQGEPIFSPKLDESKQNTLLNINTGTQSIGADYLFTTKSRNPSDYLIYRFGVSAKATEGVGSLITNGQFSPGVKLTAARTKIRLFANPLISKPDGTKRKFDDWLTFTGSFIFEKNKLFKKDTTFAKQITDTTFTGYSLGMDYNMVLGTNEQDYINFGLTYNRRNNYNDLTSVDVVDKRIIFDSVSATQRNVEKKVSAKEGTYKEMDAAVIQLSYTHLPKYQFKNLKNPDGSVMMKEKEETVTEYITYTNVRIDTVTRTNRNSQPITEYINYTQSRIDTVTRTIKKSEPVPNPNFKSIKFGYSFFYNVLVQKGEKPETKLGGSIFLISPDKDNNLIPRLAINFQIKDLYDLKNANNGLAKRFQAGVSATFPL